MVNPSYLKESQVCSRFHLSESKINKCICTLTTYLLLMMYKPGGRRGVKRSHNLILLQIIWKRQRYLSTENNIYYLIIFHSDIHNLYFGELLPIRNCKNFHVSSSCSNSNNSNPLLTFYRLCFNLWNSNEAKLSVTVWNLFPYFS